MKHLFRAIVSLPFLLSFGCSSTPEEAGSTDDESVVMIEASPASRAELGVVRWRGAFGAVHWSGVVGQWESTMDGLGEDGKTVVALQTTNTIDDTERRYEHVLRNGGESGRFHVARAARRGGGESLRIENSFHDASPKVKRSLELALADVKASRALSLTSLGKTPVDSATSRLQPQTDLVNPGGSINLLSCQHSTMQCQVGEAGAGLQCPADTQCDQSPCADACSQSVDASSEKCNEGKETCSGLLSDVANSCVGIPSEYVNDNSDTLHDLCSYSPDQYPSVFQSNADFSGPCARHDLCLEKSSSRSPCDTALLADMRKNCECTYGKFNPNRQLCYVTANTYHEVVVAKTTYCKVPGAPGC